MLLSADNRIKPVLAYSESEKFEIDEEFYPEGLRYWIKDAKEQITQIQNSNIEQAEEYKLAWEFLTITTAKKKIQNTKNPDPYECTSHSETYTRGPLLQTNWYQTGGFNDELPYITCNGNPFQVFAGCVPIAMGQIMKFHQYPTSYNWSAMPNASGSGTSALFIKDIHTAIKSVYSSEPSYNCSATGVSNSRIIGYILRTKFGFSSADWGSYNYQTVKSNLVSGRPVILSGSNDSSGHMWVCDGYRQTNIYNEDCTGTGYLQFYMNWGWGGSNNGWYAFNNFNPGNTHYNNNNKMTYNIIP